MKNIVWNVFLITGVSNLVNSVPVGESGNGYKLEILSKNQPNSPPINSGSFADKLDLSSIFTTVTKNIVPALLQKHESGSVPGKETTHHLGPSVTESVTKGLYDAFNSKLGQEIMIAAGIKKRPTLMETIYETIMKYIRLIEETTSHKIQEVGEKGLIKTFSDTFFGIFGSPGHITTNPSHEIHKPATINGITHQHGAVAGMQTRDISDLRDRLSNRRCGGRYQRPGSGPWNSFLYQPYDRYNPYSTMPPFMGGGALAYVGYLIACFFNLIQEFFYRFFSGHPPPPPPGGRPSILRRPPQSYNRF